MFTRTMRRGTGKVMFLLCSGLCTSFLVLDLACAGNNKAYDNPAPNISLFVSGTVENNTFSPTVTKDHPTAVLSVAVGGSAWFRANFSGKDAKVTVTPAPSTTDATAQANPIVSNRHFRIDNITTSTVTFTVTSGNGQKTSASVPIHLMVAPSSLHYAFSTKTFYKGLPIVSASPTVTGGGTYTYSVSPALPSGLALDASTGVISGTPTAILAAADYTVTAKDAVNQSTTAVLHLDVADTPIDFNLSPNTIAPGGTSILGWNGNKVAGIFSTVAIVSNPADATLPASFGLTGTANVSPAASTTYTITATRADGAPAYTRTINLTVGSAPVAITLFDASPSSTVYGGTTDLTWEMTGVPLSLTLDGTDVLGLNGKTVTPVRRQTFVLTGSNALNLGTPSTLTKVVASRGNDALAGSTLAGGWQDGTGSAAKLTLNSGPITSTTGGSMNLSMDGSGNLLIADAANHVVRMATPLGVVSTLAGKPGVSFINAVADGTGGGIGSAARFNKPAQVIAIDANTLYEIDYGTNSMRSLVKQGDGTWLVTNIAGTPGTFGNATTQNLDNPLSIATYNGKVYIADGYTSSIRVYDPAAAVGSRLSTLAGSGSGQQFGLLDATGTAARFRTCSSIAIDPAQGDIYVADRETHTIRKVTQAGVVTTIAGAYPAATAGNVDATGQAARFNRPTGIVRAPDGTLYVTDNMNHSVRKLVYNGTAWDVTTVLGTGVAGNVEGVGTAAAFTGPEGITMDASGNLYVADAGNFQIRKVTISGGVYTTSPFVGARQSGLVNATGDQARFALPNGVVVDSNGNGFVADEGNKVIRMITPAGAVTTFGTGVTLTAPYAMTIDASNNIYVLDRLAANIAVVKITPAGVMSTVALTGYVFPNNNPRGIAVTGDSAILYIADGNNIRRFDLTTDGAGVTSGVAGATITSGLTSVNGLATATDGLYWVEFGTHTIKKAGLDLSAPVVVAGTSGSRGFTDGAGAAARFYAPVSLVLAKDGSGACTKIYVCDQGNHAVRVIDRGQSDLVSTLVGAIDTSVASGLPGRLYAAPGTLGTTGTAGVYFPKGIARTPQGDLLVTTSDGVMQITAP